MIISVDFADFPTSFASKTSILAQISQNGALRRKNILRERNFLTVKFVD